jgi:hypothetical protein
MEKLHPLVVEYHNTILGFDAPAYAKMNGSDAERKYTKIYRRLSPLLIQAHLRGDVTLAVCLINTTGSAKAAVLDIDAGGEAALMRVRKQAEEQRLIAFAQSSTNHHHDGGHIWLLFDGWQTPERFRLLANTLAEEAEVAAESYPTRKAIRLPLGVHRWTGKRGRLFLPDGTVLNLDEGEQVVKEAIHALRALPYNSVDLLPELPMPRRANRDAPESFSARREGSHDVIRDYNHSTNLITLLESSGGRVAQWLPTGGALMHCPCPHHKHRDARPSIEIRPAKNRERYNGPRNLDTHSDQGQCTHHDKKDLHIRVQSPGGAGHP